MIQTADLRDGEGLDPPLIIVRRKERGTTGANDLMRRLAGLTCYIYLDIDG